MNRRWIPLLLALPLLQLCLVSQALAAAPDGSASASLASLVAEALANNPDLKAAESRWHLYDNKVTPASSLDDPQLSFDFSNYPIDTLAANETAMTGDDLKLSQKFPFPGKLAAKGEIAQQQALWYRQVYRDGRLQLAARVKDAYYRLFFRDRAIAIIQKNIAALDDFIKLTETRYQVGKGLQQDVLKAQVERSKLMATLFTQKQERESALADLNTLVGRPVDTPATSPADLAMPRNLPAAAELQHESEQERPLYAAYLSVIDRYKAQRKLAKLDYWPDFNLWAGYRIRENAPGDPVSGTDFVSAGVTVNLPVYRAKRQAAVAEADSGVRMALAQFADFRNKVSFGIQDAYAKAEKNRDQTLLYRTGVIPQAQQSYQAALAGYQVGKIDFLTLIDNLLTLYRYQIDYYRVLADYQRNVAHLEAVSGVVLEPRNAPAPETMPSAPAPIS